MRPYRYTAYTPEGAKRRGIVVADDEADASTRLGAQGLMAAELRAEAVAAPGRWRERRIDRDMLSVFTRQMAVLLGAGLTVEAALTAVEGAAVSARVERVIARARAGLMGGAPLAQALEAAGGGLPAWYLAALGAGERAGELPTVFATLADHLEGSVGERAAVASALVYPAFVIVVALAVCAVLMTTVAPEIAALFEGSGQPLPPLTVAVMAVTDAVIGARWWLAAAGLALVALAMAAARIPDWRAARDRASLRMPLLGRMRRMGQAAQYLRTLALVVASRLPLTEALEFAAGVLDIAEYRAQALAAAEALRRGDSLTRAMAGLSFLHPVSRQLLEAGEAGARLAPMADRAALLAETWMRTERKRLTAFLEPAAMVFVGLAVLVIVLAVLLPVFDMQMMVTL
jgi:general secretion pathway protein F